MVLTAADLLLDCLQTCSWPAVESRSALGPRHRCFDVCQIREGSILQSCWRPKLHSQIAPRPTRSASPPGPTNCDVTSFVAGSIFVSGLPRLVTQTAPEPMAMSPPAPGISNSIVATTRLAPTSIRETVPSSWLSTQTEPKPTARNR